LPSHFTHILAKSEVFAVQKAKRLDIDFEFSRDRMRHRVLALLELSRSDCMQLIQTVADHV